MKPIAPQISGGIPPDPDHLQLMICCYRDCEVNAYDQPLVVTAADGKMATFCRVHYDILTRGRI